MINHLAHEKLVELRQTDSGTFISITDKGLKWLKEHDDSKEQNSIKTWLIKPIAVAVLTTLVTVPVSVYVTQSIASQQSNEASKCE